MINSKFTSDVIQCCMINNLSAIKTRILSEEIKTDGNNKEKFYEFFEKTLSYAHKKSKGDWSLTMETADWIKDRNAMTYDFYDGKSNQPSISVVVEETENGIWLEVLKG